MGYNEGRLGGGPGKDGMTLATGDYLNILKDDIHSVVFATVDRDGPVSYTHLMSILIRLQRT